MKILLQQCIGGCRGRPQPTRIGQTFVRGGGQIVITINHIPVYVCSQCSQSFIEEETRHQLKAILRSLHRRLLHKPARLPAKLQVDFEIARQQPDPSHALLFSG